MEINCTGLLLLAGVITLGLGLLSGESKWFKASAWCFGIWFLLQICGFIFTLFLWNSYKPRFQELQTDDCPSGVYVSTDTGIVCKETILTEPATPEPWTFTSHSDAVVQLSLAEEKVGADAHITISCTGHERQWRSTIEDFSTELYKDSIFGIPAESFCSQGGSFKLDN